MRNLAVAMLLMGSLFLVIAGVFMVRDPAPWPILGILIPSISLLVAGGIILRQYRQ
jgi:lipopolysaccharide export LptBFGC system permease protein LptF